MITVEEGGRSKLPARSMLALQARETTQLAWTVIPNERRLTERHAP